MSADNWADCPKCSERGESSLREDYEIGILDGEFYVIYTGECRECGFKFQSKYEERV